MEESREHIVHASVRNLSDTYLGILITHGNANLTLTCAVTNFQVGIHTVIYNNCVEWIMGNFLWFSLFFSLNKITTATLLNYVYFSVFQTHSNDNLEYLFKWATFSRSAVLTHLYE